MALTPAHHDDHDQTSTHDQPSDHDRTSAHHQPSDHGRTPDRRRTSGDGHPRHLRSRTAGSRPARRTRLLAAAAGAAALALALAACGSPDHDSMPGMDHGGHHSGAGTPAPGTKDPMPGMSHEGEGDGGADHGGMDHGAMASGDGLAATRDGYTLASGTSRLPAGKAVRYPFGITGPDGKPVTSFEVDQTKRMHFYAVRADLTGFQHLHPTLGAGGRWSADLSALAPGSWRVFASFSPGSGSGKGKGYVLSRTVTVPGAAKTVPLPAPAATAEADGYTVTVKGSPMAGMAHPMTVSIARNGTPVTDLEPYLGTYAHLTAFHEGDRAFAHLHPQTEVTGDRGGPDLSFLTELPKSGKWRLFLQFRTGGKLHTAAVTLRVS